MTLARFLDELPYRPDPFQLEAAAALERGSGVLVTAPTGSGKTLIAEMAVHLARSSGRRTFYTTPIKALSNQKFADFTTAYGAADVGLLTGDNVVNPTAPIVVMTTEVLRNMIYADVNALDDVEYVVLDEVHYLQDRFRGAVWEEIIIHAPRHVRLVALSATIANAEEFAGWLTERRGNIELIVSTTRPVPLENHYLMADASADPRLVMLPLFVERDGRLRSNQRIQRALSLESGRRSRYTTPRRVEVIEKLADEQMLPVIYFIFSRAGCDAAALAVVESGIRLTDPDDRSTIRRVAEDRTAHLSDDDLGALGYPRWVAGLEAGISGHHAGMVPAFKETVEVLFSVGLIKVVFATETLALGINMPARSVVIDSLSKFDGESHRLLEPGDYTQLTGRAGRRGIDVIGHGVVLHSRYVGFDRVTEIAETGSHPLRSSFRPTYNMAANLIANYDQSRAEVLLSASLAQYQRSGSASSGREALGDMETRLANELSLATCERGSVAEYAARVDVDRSDGAERRDLFIPGDVIDVNGGRKDGRYVVLRRLARSDTGLRYLVMSTSGRTSTVTTRDLPHGTGKVATIEVPAVARKKEGRYRQQILRALRSIPSPKRHSQPTPLPRVDHPVAACPDVASHVSWLRKSNRTQRRIEQLRDRLRSEGFGLVEEFHAIEALLDEWEYVDGWALTGRGERLRSVYNELDLLLVESIERGLFQDLDLADLAALLSCFVYEARTDQPAAVLWPSKPLEARFVRLMELNQELADMERRHGLPIRRSPDPGFVQPAWAWSTGSTLDELPSTGLSPGDFVRVSRQLVDLLRQIRDTVPELVETARQALTAIDRGVVAAQGIG